MDSSIEKMKQECFYKQHIYSRLNNIFSNVLLQAKLPSMLSQSSIYWEKDKSSDYYVLSVFFDNGIDPDPAFSGPIKAEIFVEEQSLWIKYISLENHENIRRECLSKTIEDWHVKFLYTDPLNPKKTQLVSDWNKKDRKIPPQIIIKLQDMREKNDLSFVFFPLSLQDTIIYLEKKA